MGDTGAGNNKNLLKPGSVKATTPQLNQYHDSQSSDARLTTENSLVTADAKKKTISNKDGVGFIKAATAAYEKKLMQTSKLHFGLGGQSEKTTVTASEGSQVPLRESERTTETLREEEVAANGCCSKNSFGDGPEVFLGGSCNPTTWRADVAIPTLNQLGISFYNPQVSDWTPDLIELEHRAKEKARVLFFVMDSETRATAGSIEAAHISGLNTKQLVLVLHPYKPHQKILNEPVSKQ